MLPCPALPCPHLVISQNAAQGLLVCPLPPQHPGQRHALVAHQRRQHESLRARGRWGSHKQRHKYMPGQRQRWQTAAKPHGGNSGMATAAASREQTHRGRLPLLADACPAD
jgi:hypothetical protein